MAAPLLLALVVGLSASFDTPEVQAQAKAVPPEEETFTTADGMQLHGLFHKSTKSTGNDPVVILLYPPGKDNNMLIGDWGGLANRLTEAGYNVFRFDWRGHGKSNDIKDTAKFWTNQITGAWNVRYIKGGGINVKPIKDQFFFKDFKDANAATNYMPVYLTDLAAARAHLDSKNDAGEINTSSIYLVGSESAATLGIGWMAAEWNRPQFSPTPNQLGLAPRYEFVPQGLRGEFDTAGLDISGAVWLSASRPASFSPAAVKSFVSGVFPSGSRMYMAPKIRDNNPMMFMYAAGDKKGEDNAKFFHLEALVGMGNVKNGQRPLNANYLKPIPKGAALIGVRLLGDDNTLGTEKEIMKFLDAQQQERKQIVRKNRDFKNLYYISLKDFGLFMQNP
jgi:hypothetical protein